MKKTLVAYYSHTGNNHYLAHRIARETGADLEEIRPRGGLFFLQLMFSWLMVSFGVRTLRHPPAQYDRLVVVGPIWTGKLIAPLRDTIRKYRDSGAEIHFVTCCGGHDGMKDETFGYEGVFRQARKVGGSALTECVAFPNTLVLTEEERDDPEAGMNTRLSDDNFTGEILNRLHNYLKEKSLA